MVVERTPITSKSILMKQPLITCQVVLVNDCTILKCKYIRLLYITQFFLNFGWLLALSRTPYNELSPSKSKVPKVLKAKTVLVTSRVSNSE